MTRLQPAGQTHLLQFWHDLTPAQRRDLADQIETLDLPLVNRLYRQRALVARDERSSGDLALRARPLDAVAQTDGADAAAARRVGAQAWRAGRTGVILVAGGNGSRLGFPQPKGMYPIGPVSGASLFQLLLERIVAASRRYGAAIPLYLMTSSGSIGVHVFRRDFLQRVADQSLPFHAARKCVPHVDVRGDLVTPDRPNAIKLEQFIFDALPLADRVAVVEVDRSSHFAPLKNRSGSRDDSPEALRRQLVALHRRWLVEAGYFLAPEALVEISPLLAQDAAELRRRLRPRTAEPPRGYLR